MCETSTAPGTIAILRNSPPTHSVISPRPAFNSTGCFSPQRTVWTGLWTGPPARPPSLPRRWSCRLFPSTAGWLIQGFLGP